MKTAVFFSPAMLDFMNTVLTLISSRPGELSSSQVEQANQRLLEVNLAVEPTRWLSEGEACDIEFSGPVTPDLEPRLRDVFTNQPIDLAIQSITGRRKKLLLSDMDSTIVTAETLDELAEFAGLKDKISAITARAMNGEIDFKDALAERVAMLKGLSSDTLAATMEQIKFSPGAKTLVRTMSAHGAFTALVSGGFTYFTNRVREAVGFDFDTGITLGIEDNKLTGTVTGKIVTKDVKRELLIRLADEHNINLTDTVTVGDGANDLPMLQTAGLGVAYHAKPVVVASAPYRVDHAGLDALLFMQGYRRDEFVV
jgi:phosphoserine phosphatase